MIILWDMKNAFKKLKTIPFPNPIEGLLLVHPYDLYVAVSPSEVMHFDLKTQSLSKSAVLSLNEDENITGFYSPVVSKGQSIENFLVATHTSAIYEIALPKTKKGATKSISVRRQV